MIIHRVPIGDVPIAQQVAFTDFITRLTARIKEDYGQTGREGNGRDMARERTGSSPLAADTGRNLLCNSLVIDTQTE